MLRTLAAAVLLALAAATTVLTVGHRADDRREAFARQAESTARQSVLAILDIDAGSARADAQRFVDASAGEFRTAMSAQLDNYVRALQQSHVTSTGEVPAIGIESQTEDSAVVLVAARTHVSTSGGAAQDRNVRLLVTVTRDGGAAKLTRLEFVS
ncbi:hypothetical protein G4X40_11015 [Rhodococcus sp. D2-41]|uniref:Mce-associated membrane protein n=1 Tax=Speluncibacter jeojiensis TaxID=2710754 RepID=A0A9X4M4U4_9ACTN|nr:hypothetical protein [Rhodococcus sp. D2-41]MDG3010679.1 hypothetical protein [Rhodococcus sp. D2-41]MDG3016859.1 hypothetical protein [Corynebacteriales bacterium D3-21]